MGKKASREKGFTLLEVTLSILLLTILALLAFPTAQYADRRLKEMELRHALREIRSAIDEYHRYAMQGLIQQSDVEQDYYPPDLKTMVDGIALVGDASNKKVRFLRRIPMDPMTKTFDWGLRSTRDEIDSDMWGGENVFDVCSTSEALALDGKTHYKEW